jgi:hypothetical protein
MAADTMRVRLYWLDGRVEQLKGDVDAGTTHIVRQTPQGHGHFTFAEEIDDEGFGPTRDGTGLRSARSSHD